MIGAGPAGLSAALILARARRAVAVYDGGAPRNRRAKRLGGFLTRDGTAPADFLQMARSELGRYDTVSLCENTMVVDAKVSESGFRLISEAGDISCRKLLVATGVTDIVPPVRGADEFYGSGVFHCPYCDGYERRNQRLAVLGHGRSAVDIALELKGWSSNVTVLTDGRSRLTEACRTRLDALQIAQRSERIAQLEGSDGRLAGVRFRSGETLAIDALFFGSVGRPNTEIARRLGAAKVRGGFIRSSGYGKTSVPGLFAAGDVIRHVQLAIVAAGEGAAAGFAINNELLKEDLARDTERGRSILSASAG
ncbi:FAD-dependent pyridine nucleotide-disulfide oxidoreductase [Afipia sp. P52-10]|nr:FAD-dependent pyridine nucleotide-disulfide oxidoreductase [Afipia sp. P52-10]